MRGLNSFPQVYLYQGVIDFRKSIDGLALIVEQEIRVDVFSEALFVFVAKDRFKLKLLYWDKSGFALWYKRLEKEKFILPRSRILETVNLSYQELERMLEGLDIFKIKPHKNLHYSRVS